MPSIRSTPSIRLSRQTRSFRAQALRAMLRYSTFCEDWMQLTIRARLFLFLRPTLRTQRTRVQESEQRREQVNITTLGGHPISLKLTVITTTKSLIRTLQTPARLPICRLA